MEKRGGERIESSHFFFCSFALSVCFFLPLSLLVAISLSS